MKRGGGNTVPSAFPQEEVNHAWLSLLNSS